MLRYPISMLADGLIRIQLKEHFYTLLHFHYFRSNVSCIWGTILELLVNWFHMVLPTENPAIS